MCVDNMVETRIKNNTSPFFFPSLVLFSLFLDCRNREIGKYADRDAERTPLLCGYLDSEFKQEEETPLPHSRSQGPSRRHRRKLVLPYLCHSPYHNHPPIHFSKGRYFLFHLKHLGDLSSFEVRRFFLRLMNLFSWRLKWESLLVFEIQMVISSSQHSMRITALVHACKFPEF